MRAMFQFKWRNITIVLTIDRVVFLSGGPGSELMKSPVNNNYDGWSTAVREKRATSMNLGRGYIWISMALVLAMPGWA